MTTTREVPARYRSRSDGREVMLTRITEHPTGEVWCLFEKLENQQVWTVLLEEFDRDFELYH